MEIEPMESDAQRQSRRVSAYLKRIAELEKEVTELRAQLDRAHIDRNNATMNQRINREPTT